LKDETPDITVSPSSTGRRITTPSMGEVTLSRCIVPPRPRDGHAALLDDAVFVIAASWLAFAWR